MGFALTTTELAAQMNVTKGRVSQWVSQGKLRPGTDFDGEGRARRFDVAQCARALGKRLDVAQSLGNGRATLKAIEAIRTPAAQPRDDEDDADDPDARRTSRYDDARTARIEEQARRLRYDNAGLSGSLLLASEVDRQVAAQIAQEIAAFELVLRRGAEAVAGKWNVSAPEVRALLIAAWREHRANRADQAAARGAAAEASDAEREADF